MQHPELFSPTAIVVVQVLWGIIMVLIGLVLKDIKEWMRAHAAELKALNDKVLACYVPRPECTLSSRDKWNAIERMENEMHAALVDIAAIKERINGKRTERG